MRRLVMLAIIGLSCGGCLNRLGRDLGNSLDTGMTLADMRQTLWWSGVFNVQEDVDVDPRWVVLYFDGVYFGAPTPFSVVFENRRARMILADTYLRSHAGPPWRDLQECTRTFESIERGLQRKFGGVAPTRTSRSDEEIRTWFTPERYAHVGLYFQPPSECMAISAIMFDGDDAEMKAFLERIAVGAEPKAP